MTFIYLLSDGSWLLSEHTHRELRAQHPGLELIRTFRNIQDARAWCQKQTDPREIRDEVKRQHRGLTVEGRQKLRDQKLGERNPNFKGLSEEHRRKIAQTQKKRRGEFHHMWNRKHRASSRLKTSWTLRQRSKRRWALDIEGKEHFIASDATLPPGWIWGRRRGQGGVQY